MCEAYANSCSQEKDTPKDLCLSTKQADKTTFLSDYICTVKQAYMPIVIHMCAYPCTILICLEGCNQLNCFKN